MIVYIIKTAQNKASIMIAIRGREMEKSLFFSEEERREVGELGRRRGGEERGEEGSRGGGEEGRRGGEEERNR